MRSFKKSSLFILLMLFGTTVVNADSTCNVSFEARGYEGGYYRNATYNGQNVKVGSEDYAIYTFYETGTNKSYTGYCMNPGYSTGRLFNQQNQTYNCQRVIGDITNSKIEVRREDAGKLAIMSSNKNEAVKDLAIRIYGMYWTFTNTNGQNATTPYAEHKKIANDWLNDSEIQELIVELREKAPNYIIKNKFAGAASSVSADASLLNEAKELLKEGLRAALNYDSQAERSLIWNDTPVIKREKTESSNNIITFNQTDTYYIDVKNFKKSETIKINVVPPTSTNITTIQSIKYYINNVEVSRETLTNFNFTNLEADYNNLIEKDGVLNGRVELKIEFVGTMAKTNVDNKKFEELPYRIDITYNQGKIGYELKPEVREGIQTFYTILDNPSALKTDSINSKLSFGVSSSTTASNCNTSISTVYCKQCDASRNTIDIVEGYEDGNPKNCEEPKTLNISKCIANDGAKDKVGNSYESNELSDNPFCAIYCKEDYKINLPGTKIVNSFRYFTLDALVTGTKTCYGNNRNGGAIDFEYARATAYQAGQRSIENYNVYAELKGQQEALDKLDTSDDSIFKNYIKQDGTCGEETTEYTYGNVCDINKSDRYQDSCKNCRYGYGYSNGAYKCVTGSTTSQAESKYVVSKNTIDYTWQQSDTSANVKPAQGTITFSVAGGEYCGDNGKSSLISAIKSALEEKKASVETDIGTNGSSYTVGLSNKPNPADMQIVYTPGTGATSKLGIGFMYSVMGAINECSAVDTNVPGFGILGVKKDNNGGTVYLKDADGNDVTDANGNKIPVVEESKSNDQTLYSIEWPGYNFDPELEFWYQEENYMSLLGNRGTMGRSSITNQEDTNYKLEYCTGEVNGNYECSTGWVDTPPMTTASIPGCSGGLGSCRQYQITYSTAKYVRKVMEKSAEFITPTYFYTIYTTGQVVYTEDLKNVPENSSILEHALPVDALRQGENSFTLLFNDLGEHYDSGKLGRIWGDSKSVVTETLRESDKCRQDSALKYEDEIGNEVFTNGVYSCEYDTDICDISCKTPEEVGDGHYHCQNGEVCEEEDYNQECGNSCKTPSESEDNKYHCKDGEVCDEDEYVEECDPCPDCPVVCDPDGCYKEDDKCPDNRCPVHCPTCLFNDGLNVDYRPVSPDDLNPNDRNLGVNWDFDDNITSALELKAYKTTTDIESDGAKIYDTDSNNQRITFKVNGSMISEIRKYNEENKEEGYYNNSLECYDYVDSTTDPENPVTYKNIYCYSTFIDRIIEKFPDQVLGVKNRKMGKTERENETQSSGYWTTWAEMREDATTWEVTTSRGIDTYFKDFKNLGIGPAWK